MKATRGAAYVLAAAFAAHVASLRAGWVLDDWELLVDNPYVRSGSGLGTLLTRELFAATAEPRIVPYYRPVTAFMNWLTYQLLGASTVLHHAFNVALHGTSAVLFYLLARQLRANGRTAMVMGLLFAVHPVSAELVAYAAGRQDLLGWVLTFGTLLAILRSERTPRIFVVAFAGTLFAALTREFFFCLPALMVVGGATAPARPRSRAAFAAGGGSALAILAVLGLRRALAITPFQSGPRGATETLGTAGAVFLRLVKDVLAPTDLSSHVTSTPASTGLTLFVFAIATAGFVYAIVVLRRRAPAGIAPLVLGGIAFDALVLLHTPVALKDGSVSDRYAYGAVAAVLLVLSPAIDALVARLGNESTKLHAGLLVAVTLVCVPFTWARAADYASDETLALAMVRDRPDDPQSLLARIAALRGAGKKAEAYPLCRRYAELVPKSHAVNPCLAEEAVAKNDYARAAKLLEPWVYSRPGDLGARNVYFEALFRTGDLSRVKAALDYFEPVEPNAPDVRAAREAYDRASAK